MREIKNIFLGEKEKKFEDLREDMKDKLKEFMQSQGPLDPKQQQGDNSSPQSPADSMVHAYAAASSNLNWSLSSTLRNIFLLGATLQQQGLKDFLLELQEKFVEVWVAKVRLNYFYSDLVFAKAIESCANYLDDHKFNVASSFLCVVRDVVRLMIIRNKWFKVRKVYLSLLVDFFLGDLTLVWSLLCLLCKKCLSVLVEV